MGAGDLGGLFDVLLVGELVVVGTEHLDGAYISVEADLFQRRQHRLHALQVAELPVQRGRRQGDGITEGLDGIKFIGHGHLGMAFADLDALAAVDAALRKDRRLVVSDSDGLRRTSLQTRRAALAFVLVKPHGKFVDDGTRYMKQSSMDERMANYKKLLELLETFGLLDKVIEIGGTYLENFEFVKAVIERYYKGYN